VGLGAYLGIYFTTLGGMYYFVSHGLLDQATIDRTINFLTEKLPSIKAYLPSDSGKQALGASLLVAVLATDLLEPVRILLTIAVTPRLARMLRNRKAQPPV